MSLDEFATSSGEVTRILGLDIGDRRIGVAISDSLGYTAQGIEVIDRKQVDWLLRISELIKDMDVGAIVVGLPRNMNGSLGPRGQLCQEMADELKARFHIPVHLWDERLSTVAAERTLIEADISRKKRKKVIDQMAASWILQGYLDSVRRV
ncbi:Holliday junction resolvase RuvX [Hazenella sp. IB182357]|uniref:Putative pre-16S rRNA nuclease n=1 Tax=Polycladospora coralii TaxID=2771432 RepID=A0A926N4U8_9BACL|nr:Holliday junction resolvase RuvX [Polycladospora coralii]MBD1371074.1 Holliday junction resolvase RuvX [Polycladospora coralii]MBS7530014.1 Holliday junction resolvase RuvX [Polycladospora coralii]